MVIIQNKSKLIDKFRKIFRDEFELEELEKLDLYAVEEVLLGILREYYRNQNMTDEKLCEKSKVSKYSKKAAIDVLRERTRDFLTQSNFYAVWKQGRCIEYKSALDGVFNEDQFNYLKNLKDWSAFICHKCPEDKKIATEIKNFLEFYEISTFTDHDDAGKFSGSPFEDKIRKEIRGRRIFILLATKKASTSNQVRREIELYKDLSRSDGNRLRLNILLEQLDHATIKTLKINTREQYINYEDGEKETFNNVLSSILDRDKGDKT